MLARPPTLTPYTASKSAASFFSTFLSRSTPAACTMPVTCRPCCVLTARTAAATLAASLVSHGMYTARPPRDSICRFDSSTSRLARTCPTSWSRLFGVGFGPRPAANSAFMCA